jgi:hypothetical protein
MLQFSHHRLPDLHQWLVSARRWAKPAGTGAAAALAVEQFGAPLPGLAGKIAAHLRSYDGDEREWFDFDSALVDVVADDYASLCLLGRQDEAPCRKGLIATLARGGRAVIEGQGVLEATSGVGNVFRVAILPDGMSAAPSFHLAADPAAFSSECLTAVIGDAFLEWLNSKDSPANGGHA